MFPDFTAIITESKFIQIALQILRINPMMRAPKPSLEIPYDSMYPREDYSCSFSNSLNFRPVLVSQTFQVFIASPAISINLAAREDGIKNKTVDRVMGYIRNHSQAYSAGMISPVFNSNDYRNLAFSTTTSTLLFGSSDVGIIYFNSAHKGFSVRIYHCPAKTPTKRQGSPIRTDPELFLQLQGGYSGSEGAHEISCPKPIAKRYMTVLQNGPCGNTYVPVTSQAPEFTQPNPIGFLFSAVRAFKSLWPAYTYEIFNAGFLSRKPPLEFAKCHWKQGVPLGCVFCSHFPDILPYLVASSA